MDDYDTQIQCEESLIAMTQICAMKACDESLMEVLGTGGKPTHLLLGQS